MVPAWRSDLRAAKRSLFLIAAGIVLLLTCQVSAQGDVKPELNVALSVGPASADPRFDNSFAGNSVLRHVYEPLFYHDAEGNLQPWLARSWRYIDERTLEIVLQEGVVFHNGEPFTSESVKYTIESIIDPDSQATNRAALTVIERIETPDPHTVRIVTSQPSRPLLGNLAFQPVGFLPPASGNAIDQRSASEAIGTGPYRMVEFEPGERVVLEENEDYWAFDPAYSRIVFDIISDAGARIAAVEAEQAMMINNVSVDQAARLQAIPHLEVVSTETARTMFLMFRFDKDIVKNDLFRHALNVAINRDVIVDVILGGYAEVATSPVPPALFAHTELNVPEFDVDEARRLLTEAGYDGEPIELIAGSGRHLMDRLIAQALAGLLEAAGVTVDLRILEWGQFANETWASADEDKSWDIAFFGWGVATGDPDWFLRPNFHSEISNFGYANESVDDLIERGQATLDESEAREIYRQLQEVLWEDLPALFLYYQPQLDVVNTRLHGYATTPDEYMYFDTLVNRTRLE